MGSNPIGVIRARVHRAPAARVDRARPRHAPCWGSDSFARSTDLRSAFAGSRTRPAGDASGARGRAHNTELNRPVGGWARSVVSMN